MADATPQLPDTNPADQRPVPIQWIAGLGIFFAIWGLVSVPWSFLEFFRGADPGEGGGTLAPHTWVIVSTAVLMLLSVLLLAGTIGIMRLREWGRVILILFSLGAIAFGVVGLFFYLPYYFGIGGEQQAGVRGVAPCCSLVLWPALTLYAIPVLYTLTRPIVKNQFAPGIEPPE